MIKTTYVVTGAQYGSEGKGHVALQYVRRAVQRAMAKEDNDPNGKTQRVVCVRVAGPNAGHTVYDAGGEKYAFRQVPVGAVLKAGGRVTNYIAPGSEVDFDVLVDEIRHLLNTGHTRADISLSVSSEVTILEDRHIEQEQNDGIQERLGSTAKGIGAARADRVWRRADRLADRPELAKHLQELGVHVAANPSTVYTQAHPNIETTVVVEGTQGYHLGLHQGNYPYCTSSDTRAIDFLAMAGISAFTPGQVVVPVLVARMYPIRVAGNSGPMQRETEWGELGLPEEHTTVTQKVRRVGEWDESLLVEALVGNGGSAEIAFTMVDQKFPEISNGTMITDIPDEASKWIDQVFHNLNSRIGIDARSSFLTTSPTTAIDITGIWGNDPTGEVRPRETDLQGAAEAMGAVLDADAGVEAEEIDFSDELEDWWVGMAAAEIDEMLEKTREYGGRLSRARNLFEQGLVLIDAGIKIPPMLEGIGGELELTSTERTIQYASELAVWQFIVGKVARWNAAVVDGQNVSDDTIHDIAVYARMAQRIRQTGGFPK